MENRQVANRTQKPAITKDYFVKMILKRDLMNF